MLDIFAHAAVIWFIIGFVLFLLEFVVPGLILFFFAAGAWIVALLCLFFEEIGRASCRERVSSLV